MAVNADFRKYVDLMPTFEKLYKEIEPYSLAKAYYDEITGRNVELFRLCRYFDRLVNAYENEGETGFENYHNRLKNYLEGYYEDYRPEIDVEVIGCADGDDERKSGCQLAPN